MDTHIIAKEEIITLLSSWYNAIISQHIIKAKHLKEEIDRNIHSIEEDSNISIYYSLLNFRYNLLVCDIDGSKDCLEKIAPFPEQTETFLKYYYHFFKAIYAISVGNHNEAKEQYEKAEKLLATIPDELEKAEFDYMFAVFHYQSLNPLLAAKYANKAKEVFSKHTGYEMKVASCQNTIGLACTKLRLYEIAEENFISALRIFEKYGEEQLIAKVKHNLGLLYADQNLSELAIKYLKDSLKNNPKTMFLLAREYYKLGENFLAADLIEQGYNLTKLKEYKCHFAILRELNKGAEIEELEKVIMTGIYYFKKENLWGHVKEYASILGSKFYDLSNDEKASRFFHIALDADKKDLEKGA
ncbi:MULTISPECIES: Rap family tetratricopeptide repeat protein [Bacillus]|uniref:Tetratricopeptide repeat protein n=2 Tax=Bacillus pseudomycoides TaxID=64104 RepID=A0AAJ2DPL4_9BACI|nr:MULTISPECIES: Rap family tetratricopeptide repeat protein [Bacillus]KFN14404.1 tetratricopeptide repeat family protein [Bacillus pseudomycoides]MCR8858183.1 tetratricopeptide repeat protein [Bacillus pseudomycoides]MCX2824821.1 tetratricopeptide repeat protein [Bacillus sp. DHT2]MDR4189483.1 tetratricopeptide repeat protein [Bacillus pseudomycoides]MDR4328588.1 tetratricopeptide repeat protein [Bacillus pseudomycoides]